MSGCQRVMLLSQQELVFRAAVPKAINLEVPPLGCIRGKVGSFKDAGGCIIPPEFLTELVWGVTWPLELVVPQMGLRSLTVGTLCFLRTQIIHSKLNTPALPPLLSQLSKNKLM